MNQDAAAMLASIILTAIVAVIFILPLYPSVSYEISHEDDFISSFDAYPSKSSLYSGYIGYSPLDDGKSGNTRYNVTIQNASSNQIIKSEIVFPSPYSGQINGEIPLKHKGPILLEAKLQTFSVDDGWETKSRKDVELAYN
jgi:hypothetical protein